MTISFNASEARAALERLPNVASQENLDPPDLRHVYVPVGHQKALSLDATVVVGMRGAGKSHWTAVLSSPGHRRFIASLTKLQSLSKLEVRVAFGLDPSNQAFPSPATLKQLGEAKITPPSIWKAVVLKHALEVTETCVPWTDTSWIGICGWVRAQPEAADRLISECDLRLQRQGVVLLAVFDSLDVSADRWPAVRALTRGALQFALECRTRRAIRLKIFLRPDMEEDPEIWGFPDSSKLKQFAVRLDWKPADLYALVFTYLANDSWFGDSFRETVTSQTELEWGVQDGVHIVPRHLTITEPLLRRVVESLTGQWMGRNHKRGFAFTWIPTHLADAVERISPRTFLLAFKKAAEVTEARFPNHELPLHYEGIHEGVGDASKTRINELTEDHPWVWVLLDSARGLTVPCEPAELLARWPAPVLKKLQGSAALKLPPRRFSTEPGEEKSALIEDLIDLAVLYETTDGRLNMPDIFRVASGIKRKGGVKPLR